MASPNPPPFSETFQKSIPRSPTLVGERDTRRSSFFANKRPSATSDYFTKPTQTMAGVTPPDRAHTSDSDTTPPNYDLDAPLHATNKALAPEDTHVNAVPAHNDDNGVENTFARLSSVRKHVLLAVFSLATALDVVSVSGLITTTESISRDLGLEAGNITWILTAYAMTFASYVPIPYPLCGGAFGLLGLLQVLVVLGEGI
jgi:hypothetical protein